MKIIKKRSIAALIDAFIMGMILVLFEAVFKSFNIKIGNWDLLLFIPCFCRDCLFGNASIGKKILGIAIYDDKWKRPGVKKLFLRSLLMSTVGYALFLKFKFVDGSLISILDWERDKFGTRVIDKKVLKRLSEEAQKQKGDFAQNMTELYNAYLRSLYN